MLFEISELIVEVIVVGRIEDIKSRRIHKRALADNFAGWQLPEVTRLTNTSRLRLRQRDFVTLTYAIIHCQPRD